MAIRDEFRVHRLNSDGMDAAEEIAFHFSGFLTEMERLCGTAGREMAIVRTKLQEANFWAKRAIAVRPELQEPPDQ